MCLCRMLLCDWIHPDNASPEIIAARALLCPSGAIAYERLDGGEPENAPSVNVVRIQRKRLESVSCRTRNRR